MHLLTTWVFTLGCQGWLLNDQYSLDQPDPFPVPEVANTNQQEKMELKRFWESSVPAQRAVGDRPSDMLVIETAKLGGRLQEFNDWLAANFFEMDDGGMYQSLAAPVTRCWKQRHANEPAEQAALTAILKALTGGRTALALDVLHLLMKNDLITSNSRLLTPTPALIRVVLKLDESYMACLDEAIAAADRQSSTV